MKQIQTDNLALLLSELPLLIERLELLASIATDLPKPHRGFYSVPSPPDNLTTAATSLKSTLGQLERLKKLVETE